MTTTVIAAQRQTVWPRLCQTLAMDEIEQFAGQLGRWAEEGQWPALRDYAASLAREVQDFDVVRLPKTLHDFPEICDRLGLQGNP